MWATETWSVFYKNKRLYKLIPNLEGYILSKYGISSKVFIKGNVTNV